MSHPTNIPAGSYPTMSDGQKPADIKYGQDDVPQIVARGIAVTDGAAAVALEGAVGVRSVAIAGTSIRVTLTTPQANAAYVVDTGQERVALDARNVLVELKTTTTFDLSMETEAGAVADLGAEIRRLTFSVAKAL